MSNQVNANEVNMEAYKIICELFGIKELKSYQRDVFESLLGTTVLCLNRQAVEKVCYSKLGLFLKVVAVVKVKVI